MNSPKNMASPQAHQVRSNDIKDLFRKFDGEPDQYQEIGRDSRAVAAESRWPILSRLTIEQVASAPAVSQCKPALRPVVSLPVESLGAAPMPAARTNQADSLSDIFQRLIGAAPLLAPTSAAVPKRSMLFNSSKT